MCAAVSVLGAGRADAVRDGERFVDANGRSVNALAVYRWGQHATPEERREAADDMDRQLADAGLVLVVPGDGYWWWYTSDQVTPDMVPIEDYPWERTSRARAHSGFGPAMASAGGGRG